MSTQSLSTRPVSIDTPWCRCTDSRWRAHHDRLRSVETDLDELLELLELAVTWSELDYGDVAVVPPERWTDFALAHVWRDPDRMERLFGLAADIALRSAPGAVGGADLLELVSR
jgi:hypothetical protein